MNFAFHQSRQWPVRIARWRLFLLMPVLALTALAFNLHAADADSRFGSANKLYEEGKYSDALAAYDQLLHDGNVSEALYFNRGNALFKLGQTGRAIASYSQARDLAPRDPDVLANLQLARTRARGGQPYHPGLWRAWLARLTLNEWTILAAGSLWLLFLLLALGQWRAPLRPILRNYVVIAGVAVVVLGACFGIALNEDYFTRTVVVIAGEADVRNGPLDEAQSIYKVRDGIELQVLDQKDDWLQVVDPAQRAGWLRRDQVLAFEPPALKKAKS